jgi:hypothetical protein
LIHCVNAIEESLGLLSNSQPCLLAARNIVKVVDKPILESLDNDAFGRLVDRLRRGLNDVHDSMARMYFLPASET